MKQAKAPVMVLVWAFFHGAFADTCPPITEQTRESIRTYIAWHYRLPAGSELSITDGDATEGCYRKITFETTLPHRSIILYLSPDAKYLLTGLMNLAEDPRAELEERATQISRDLVSEDSPSRGSKTAPVTIVEFEDFQCPYCLAFEQLFHSLPAEVQAKTQLIFKHMPFPIHDWARRAALASVCLDTQSREAFWRFHDFLFLNQAHITAENFERVLQAFAVRNQEINIPKLDDCVRGPSAENILIRDSKLAEKYRIPGTPTLFINGYMASGIRSESELERLINQGADERR
jgi:protein-disulfide isomerase